MKPVNKNSGTTIGFGRSKEILQRNEEKEGNAGGR